jgi:hypothetical protein
MLSKLVATGTGPGRGKNFASASFTIFFCNVMLLVRMLTAALEVLRAIDRNIVKVSALASWVFTLYLPTSAI